MEIVITAVIALLLGGVIVFLVKRMQDQTTKKSARMEAERILNRAKSESTKIKKDSETKAKDFESRARKNVEADIHKQKSTLKNKEAQLERRV
jgi:ribonuclease Y